MSERMLHWSSRYTRRWLMHWTVPLHFMSMIARVEMMRADYIEDADEFDRELTRRKAAANLRLAERHPPFAPMITRWTTLPDRDHDRP